MPTIQLPKHLSAYEMLITPDNFRLAWDRVRYFDRLHSRDWIGLKVFAANRDYNLEILRQSLIERTFEPSYPEIKYIPKPSLTLRPIAMLTVSDRVIFQAIANVAAEKGRATLAMTANRQSYANVLAEPGQSPLFVHWKHQYRLFQDKFCDLIKEGNAWLAETDAAAFYETIDHKLLYKCLIDNNFLDEKSVEYLENYLPIWSSTLVQAGFNTTRGVPQGCLASDLFANIFLHEFDLDLASQEYHYLRYVDDIRILGKTKSAVQRGLIHIDIALKSRGILLQTTKTTVRCIQDIDEEIDRLSAQLSEIDQRLREPEPSDLLESDPILEPYLYDTVFWEDDFTSGHDSLSPIRIQERLRRLFWKSKHSLGSNDDPFAERHLRFCLYRLEPDSKIVDAILPYFTERPWLAEIIALYLQKCSLSEEAVNTLKNVIINHSIYDSVVATAIEVLLKQGISLRAQHDVFRKWLIDGKRDWPLLCAAAMALGDSSDNMGVLLRVLNSEQPSVRRMAVIQSLRLARTSDEASHIFNGTIQDLSPSILDTLLYLLYNEWSLTIQDLNLINKSISDYCILSARGYDDTLPKIQVDYIRHVFTRSYCIETSTYVDFHELLKQNYDRAAHFLWQAENSFLVNPSRYASQLDLFHEELLYPIIVDKMQRKESREKLSEVELTNRIEMLQNTNLASFASALRECRQLRRNPETHTRLHRQLTETSKVTWRQRNALKKRLCAGYQELVDWLEAGSP